MSHDNPFLKLAEHYRLPSEIAQRFGELYESDPHTARSLLLHLHELVGEEPSRNGAASHRRRRSGSTKLDTVIEFFVENDNRMCTKADIAEGTGLNNAAVHTSIYTTGRGLFESQRGFRSKASGYRLRPDVLEKTSKGGESCSE